MPLTLLAFARSNYKISYYLHTCEKTEPANRFILIFFVNVPENLRYGTTYNCIIIERLHAVLLYRT